MKKTISIVFALLLVAMLFVSCSKGGEDKPDNSPVVDPGKTSEPSGGDGEVSEIAVILQSYTGSFCSDVMRGVDKAIEELGEKGVKCTFNGPDDSTNLQAQIEMIEAAVARDVDGLAVAPADSAAVGGAMGICQEKNIPVVLFDCSADSDWPVCLVSSDNYKLAPTLSATQEAGRIGDVKIVAIDITPVSLEYIKDGSVAAVVTQNPFNMGYTGTMTAYKAALGEEVPEFIDSGSAIVDKDSMENDEATRAILKELQLLDA